MSKSIENLLSAMPSSTRSSKYMDQLPPEVREELHAFEEWLLADDGKSPTTAKAYRGYVAKAIVHLADGGSVEDRDVITTDVKSAVNALVRFRQAIGGAAFADDTEDHMPVEIDDEV